MPNDWNMTAPSVSNKIAERGQIIGPFFWLWSRGQKLGFRAFTKRDIVSGKNTGTDGFGANKVLGRDDLGWSQHFADQVEPNQAIARICDVHRTSVTALAETGDVDLVLPPKMSISQVTVGDWVVFDDHVIDRVLDRATLLQRQSAGAGATLQLIAANVDRLLIVTSCNDDFNPARLERYLILAMGNDIEPVIVLTKADLCDDADQYLRVASDLSPGLDVVALDARSSDGLALIFEKIPDVQTAALVGSSGVGKSTLLNGLTGADAATQGIREDDAKGRHTTTARSLRQTKTGAWVIDTPGIRSLGLGHSSLGIERVFTDLSELAAACKFNDCSHTAEPKCAVQAAVQAGMQDSARVERWKKLLLEDAENTLKITKETERMKQVKKNPMYKSKRRRQLGREA